MFFQVRKPNRNLAKAQIAVFLLLILALVIVFIVVTTNVGEISHRRTMVSNAADSAALRMASTLGSLGWAQWLYVMYNLEKSPAEIQAYQTSGDWEVCQTNWWTVITMSVMIFLAVITIYLTAGGAAPAWFAYFGATTAVSAAIMTGITAASFMYTVLKGPGAAALLEGLSDKERIIEDTLSFTLSQIVDDQKMVPDVHDINFNGDHAEEVSAFQQWWYERLRAKQGKYNVATEIRDRIKDYEPKADDFRLYVGGIQEFPELLDKPELIAPLRAQGSDIPDNNNFYPQDGEMMKLMAEFGKKGLPRQNCAAQQPIRITNLNVANINAPFPYTEELVYYFPFWEYPNPCPDKEGRSYSCDNPPGVPYPDVDPIYQGQACEFAGTGSQDLRQSRIDEPDYLIDDLKQFRWWAWGVADDQDFLGDPENNDRATFNRGVGQLSDSEVKRTIGNWAKDLMPIPVPAPPDGGDPAKSQWYTHIADLMRKVKGNGECGWWKEFDNVLRKKEFFNPNSSDFHYAGLGKIGLTYARGVPWCSGKRKELREKMDRICRQLLQLVPIFNNNRCPLVNLPSCEAGSWVFEAQTTPLFLNGCLVCNYSADPCTKELISTRLPCIQTVITQIQTKITQVNAAITRLNQAANACDICCQGKFTACKGVCPGFDSGTDSCMACGGEQAACDSDCWTCPDPIPPSTVPPPCYTDGGCVASCCAGKEADCAACVGACTAAFNQCSARCAAIRAAAQCRNTEITNLNNILRYAQFLLTLANTTDQVEKLILRTETALNNIHNFYDYSASFYNYITDPALVSRVRNLIELNQLDDKTVQYDWVTKTVNGDIAHTARVQILGDFKIPSLKGKRCRWIFGQGTYLVDHTGDIGIRVTRTDSPKDLMFKLFNFTFRGRTISAESSAHFSPRLSEIRLNSAK